jgi:hypothetical protein
MDNNWRGGVVEEDFVKVAETKDIQTSQMRAVEFGGEKVCLSNVMENIMQ